MTQVESVQPELRLGKKLGVVQDPRTFKLKRFLDDEVLPTPPKSSRIAHNTYEFPMFANDTYGDCTCAAHGHRVVIQERSSSQSRKVTLTNEDILAAYSAVTGFDRNRPETDNGAYMLDVLNHMRHVGIGREADGTPHTITAFAKVNHRDLAEVKLAHWMFGGLYVGAALPNSAATEMYSGLNWSATTDSPGGWGGHAMHTRGYDAKGVEFITWGSVQKATWDWFTKYVDECYVVISEDFFKSKSGKTPQGFKLDALNRALERLS